MPKHYINEVGTDILLDCGIDISDAAVQEVYYWKPEATAAGSWTGAIYSSYSTLAGANGTNFVKYTLGAGDLNAAGVWKFQAFIANATGTWWGEMVEETIFNILT